ncbi:MAG: DUF6569 family protein [Desulfosoma sp.]
MARVSEFIPKSLSLGNIIQHASLGMLPIRDGEAVHEFAAVVLLDEALEQGWAEITETDEAGQVPFLRIKNRGQAPILVLDGEELKGGKQNRIVNASILVLAGMTLTMPVSCMEAGRWRAKRKDFEAAKAVFPAMSRRRHKESVTVSLRHNRGYFSDQHAVWDEVACRLTEAGARSATQDFQEARNRADGLMEEYVEKLKPESNQVGAIFFGPQGLLGGELLGSENLFQKAFPKILKSFAFEVLYRPPNPPSAFEKAADWWRGVLHSSAMIFPSPGAGNDLRVDSAEFIGSGLVWSERLLHFSCFPGDSNQKDCLLERTTRRASVSERKRRMGQRNRNGGS